MSRYFTYFPKITYMGKVVTDITRKVSIIETLTQDPYAFLPYTIKDNERPEDVAYYYYGDQNKVWMVYIANSIIDPYTQWPMSNENLDKTIIAKYATQANTTGYGVITWAMNSTIDANIVHYQNVDDPELKINTETFTLDTSINASEWYPVRIYDYEVELNESLRSIFLINSAYANQVERDLEKIMNV